MQRIFFLAFLFGSIELTAQSYPQGYFRNPLNIPILLAGNFGECRLGHFHSGMDIKTEGKENLPVFSAADGYVSRIKMEPGGFGHGLYITHPNGYTTLYAHLNNFVPMLQERVRKEQYATESWTVDLHFSPDQFPVKKGQQIAWSGNTGGSTAPHLHFEIRNTKTEHPLNPQLFGFAVTDSKAPVLKQLVLYDMSQGIYQSEQHQYPLTLRAGQYRLSKDSISTSSEIAGIGLVMDDYMNGSDNTLAIYSAEWYLDNALQGRITLDDIGYDVTRYLHAFADYSTKEAGGPWIQCLFQLPGNKLNQIYSSMNNAAGLLKPGDQQFHEVRILVRDVSGNQSENKFYLRCGSANGTLACKSPARPGKLSTFKTDQVSFYLDELSLYDNACISITKTAASEGLSGILNIGRPGIPVHHYFELSLKTDKLIPFSLRNKVAIVYSDGKDEFGKAATLGTQGWYKASFRDLGSFHLVIDTTAPVLTPVGLYNGNLSATKSLVFNASDEISSVKSFKGLLDGHWILFEQHEHKWTYVFDAHCPKGSHKLVIRLSDENDNERTTTYTFNR